MSHDKCNRTSDSPDHEPLTVAVTDSTKDLNNNINDNNISHNDDVGLDSTSSSIENSNKTSSLHAQSSSKCKCTSNFDNEELAEVKPTITWSGDTKIINNNNNNNNESLESKKSHFYSNSYIESLSLDINNRENVFFIPDEPIFIQITGHEEEPSLVVLHTNVYTIQIRHGRFSWTIKRKYKHFLKLYEAYALFKTKLNIKSVAVSTYLTHHSTSITSHAAASSTPSSSRLIES
jgi:hypothetical protein